MARAAVPAPLRTAEAEARARGAAARGAYKRALRTRSRRRQTKALEAMETAQDALLKAHQGLAGFRGDSSLRHFARRITVRCAMRSRRRSQGRERRTAPLSEALPHPDLDAQPFPDKQLYADFRPSRYVYRIITVFEIEKPAEQASLTSM